MKVARRYVNVKIYKRPIGLCIVKECRKSATVKATQKLSGLSVDIRLCASHANQGGVT